MYRKSFFALLIGFFFTTGVIQAQSQTIVDIATGNDDFSTLVTALQAAELVETLQGEGPFTVFAPTNAAFEALPDGTLDDLLLPENQGQLANILLYHVVPGSLEASDVLSQSVAKTATSSQNLVEFSTMTDSEGQTVAMIDNAVITQTDIIAENGVVHVIDAVILPEELTDIVDTAVSAGSFSTLVAAVQAAGLEETLRGEGPFTILAPTDQAFEALPEGTVESLLEEENLGQLQEILLFHVIPGKVISPEIVTLDSAESQNGLTLDISVSENGVMVNNANVVTTDIDTSNGVIHVIDQVLIPSSGVNSWEKSYN